VTIIAFGLDLPCTCNAVLDQSEPSRQSVRMQIDERFQQVLRLACHSGVVLDFLTQSPISLVGGVIGENIEE
jgi:hypothetical protein